MNVRKISNLTTKRGNMHHELSADIFENQASEPITHRSEDEKNAIEEAEYYRLLDATRFGEFSSEEIEQKLYEFRQKLNIASLGKLAIDA